MSDSQERILSHFRQICRIPHASGQEAALCEFLAQQLRRLGGAVRCDAAGNLMAEFPARGADPALPAVILQAHMDMVVAGELPPEQAVVTVVENGDQIETDRRTSLGADNGIGIAVILALLEDPAVHHGPLYVLFTVSEEVGLRGAAQVDPAFLQKAQYLINLDGFHSDTIVVGCKSGLREFLRRSVTKIPTPASYSVCELCADGFIGGHSGDDIDRGRCNTIRLMAQLLCRLKTHLPSLALQDLTGGTNFNVIPAFCRARIALNAVDSAALPALTETLFQELALPFRPVETGGVLTCKTAPDLGTCWDSVSEQAILHTLSAVDNGVVVRSEQGRVSASCNLGCAYTDEDGVFTVKDMLRCDTAEQEEALLRQHRETADSAGFRQEVSGYHSWRGDPDSRLVRTICDACRSVDQTRQMQVINALVGIEPSYFQEKAPALEIVCLGADICNAHAVKECVSRQSISFLFRLVAETLSILSKGGEHK